MERVWLGLGSNLGDKKKQLALALAALDAKGIIIGRKSSLYKSKPWGFKKQPPFINAVAEVFTDLRPQELLSVCQQVEYELGRERLRHWGPRIIDIDILLLGERQIKEDNLQIPHPYITERNFVLLPLSEIEPQLIIPGQGRVDQLLSACGHRGIARNRKKEW